MSLRHILLCLSIVPLAFHAQGLRTGDLKCENLYDPLGIDNTAPHFSWKNYSPRNNARQTAWEIQVGTDSVKVSRGEADLWSSGKRLSAESVMVGYEGRTLRSGMLCFWRVRTWDERSKVSSWSDIHRFSVGLLTDKDFPGEYIGLDKSAGDVTAPILRKRFKLRGRHRVFIHVNSLGYHEVRVNGRKVGDAVLAPAVSQLDKRSHIVTYDITPYSREGDNEVEIWLGKGWYRENLFHAEYEGPLVKAAVMRQNGAGWQPVAVTDSSWEGTPSGYHDFGTWQALQFGGERVDARILHNSGRHWTKAHVVNVANKTATPQMTEGNRIIDTLKPVSITAYDGGWLVDFGRDITGWLRLEMPDVPGDVTVRMEYGDWIDTTGVFTPQGEYDEYITAGDGKDVFCNKFHHHAFRYVLVKNIRQPRAEDLTALQISGDYAETVSFKCSDDDINSIYQMISRTMRCLTFSGYMVDCPHLERMGYGGDGNSSTMTVQTLCDVAPVYYNWLTAWGDAMAADGDLPYVAPAGGGGGGPYRNSFIIKAPLRTYLNYGDRRMLVKLYGQMKRWLGFVGRHVKDGLIQPWADTDRRMWFLGDWLAPKGVDVGGDSQLLTGNCVLSDCLNSMSLMADILGEKSDAGLFAAQRDSLNRKIHARFYHPADSTYATGSPLDMSYPMLTGVVPDSLRSAVTARLLALSRGKYKSHIAAGLVGTYIFTQWAVDNGECQLMYDILKKRSYPGYLYMIDHGATTTWEYWSGERSHIHNCYNGVGIWFTQALGGIVPDMSRPGYRHVLISPQKPDGIDWVSVDKETPYGTIRVSWHGARLSVEIPVGVTAMVVWQGRRHEDVGSGKWTF